MMPNRGCGESRRLEIPPGRAVRLTGAGWDGEPLAAGIEEASEVEDLADVVRGVVERAKQRLLDPVRLAADERRLAQIGVHQGRQCVEECLPAALPRGCERIASVGGAQDELVVAVAGRLL